MSMMIVTYHNYMHRRPRARRLRQEIFLEHWTTIAGTKALTNVDKYDSLNW